MTDSAVKYLDDVSNNLASVFQMNKIPLTHESIQQIQQAVSRISDKASQLKPTASNKSKVVTSAGKKCDSCEVVMVNGVRTHERGCPDAWKDYKEECKWCGSEFKPKEKGQRCCSKSCEKSYNS